MSVLCSCKLASAPGAFPATYDNAPCPTHGPEAPRYFVDHDTIHDRVTGKHLSTKQAAILLSSAYDAEAIDYDAVETIERKAEAERQERLYFDEVVRQRLANDTEDSP